MRTIPVLIVLSFVAWTGCSDETTPPPVPEQEKPGATPDNSTVHKGVFERAGETTGRVLREGAEKTGEVLEKGAKATGKALDKARDATGKALIRTGEWMVDNECK